ncbi:Crp/Fnr family transcriptional regulator [Chryseobacterium sp. MP_3.2]|uniref:Crp/Fnr family transcriptional regulator n=1 Tax=Chryseobacterium sp. MP_3.2 TaxID=3071712 RepID=UPI002E031F75|nr:CRP-like cAMP-binding protein [Chryseobacterium sp. MP_3.2]
MTVPEDYLDDPFFYHLSDRERSVLNANASIMTFDQEEMFIKNESLLFSVFYIYKGQVKIKDQKNRLCDLYGKKDFIGLRYLFNEIPVYFSAYGVKGAQIIQFEKNVFKKFASTNSKFLVDLYNMSSVNVSALSRNLISYKLHKINGSLADFLIHYHEKDCLNFLKQKEISEVLGYSRENVCKCMNEFTAEGYIEYTEGSIKILDMEALRAIKKFG